MKLTASVVAGRAPARRKWRRPSGSRWLGAALGPLARAGGSVRVPRWSALVEGRRQPPLDAATAATCLVPCPACRQSTRSPPTLTGTPCDAQPPCAPPAHVTPPGICFLLPLLQSSQKMEPPTFPGRFRQLTSKKHARRSLVAAGRSLPDPELVGYHCID